MRALLIFILRAIVWAAMIVLFAGLIVRFTIRDSVEQLGVIFYATPWLVLTALSLIITVYWLWSGKRIAGYVFVMITIICSGFWFQNKIHLHPQQAVSEKTLRFSYWNVGRPAWRLKGVLDVADSVNANVQAFGESQNKPNVKDPRWQERLSNQKMQWLRRGMLMAAREDIELVESGSLKGRGDYEVCRIRHDEKEVYIMLVDFSPSPTRTRRIPFEKLYTVLEKYADERLILAGDFNTPADSVYLDPVRAKLKNAFETAGRGNADTWPSLLPALAIDQVWLSPGLRAVACKNRSSIYSDHCMVVTDIVVE